MTQCGYIAFVGEPNAGKSTLFNQMLGSKIAIVTHKVQTTRTRMRGIVIEGDAQMILVDTPGLFQPRRRLDRAMVTSAWTGAFESDVIGLIVEAHRGLTAGVERIIERIEEQKPQSPIVLIINKIDKAPSASLLELTQKLNARYDFHSTYMICAEKGSGVPKLMQDLAKFMPKGVWLYPEDQISDMPLRLIAADITREKIMLRLHDELPYQLTVENEEWKERKDGSVRISQLIYVSRAGHKGILLGKGGETIKGISQAARQEISALLGQNVHLFLQVKVDPKWLDTAERYENIGLNFKDGA